MLPFFIQIKQMDVVCLSQISILCLFVTDEVSQEATGAHSQVLGQIRFQDVELRDPQGFIFLSMFLD